MKTTLFLFLVYSLLACGGAQSETSLSVEKKSTPPLSVKKANAPKTKPTPPQQQKREYPVISELKFLSPAQSKTDLELQAKLEVPDKEVRFDFRWFVNDKEITEVRTSILPSHRFKNGDWVHCRVTAIKEDMESRMVKSKYVKILGAPPVLKLGPIEEFSVPGKFHYQIRATDPDAVYGEENTLSFELISPKDLGLSLDPKTGEINWDLSEETIKKLKDKIKIKFKVIKKGAPEVSSSITLTFSQPEQQKKDEPIIRKTSRFGIT